MHNTREMNVQEGDVVLIKGEEKKKSKKRNMEYRDSG